MRGVCGKKGRKGEDFFVSASVTRGVFYLVREFPVDFHLSLTEAENKALEELADYLRNSRFLSAETRPGARREELRGIIAEKAGAYGEETGLSDWLARRQTAIAGQRSRVNEAIVASEPGSEHRYRLIFDLVDVLGRLEAVEAMIAELSEGTGGVFKGDGAGLEASR